MKKITGTELKEVIRKHIAWLNNEDDGERANLSCANLSCADLCSADLSCADLSCADLCSADLSCADLSCADLCSADLSCADLSCADLCSADLCGANLSGANLERANLWGADLCGANLERANLSGANLDNIDWNIHTSFYPIQCPESGSFIGYKRAQGKIVKLEICEDALRSSATSRKCRCSKARVLEIQEKDGSSANMTCIPSDYNTEFIYTVGEIVSVDNFDTNRWNECAPGIHFFITREEAVKY